jgi:porin
MPLAGNRAAVVDSSFVKPMKLITGQNFKIKIASRRLPLTPRMAVFLMSIAALATPSLLFSQAAKAPAATSQVDNQAGLAISGNPAAAQDTTGTDELQRLLLKQLGIENNHGIYFGGLWLSDCNWLITGGENPGALSCNSALVLDNHIDLQKLTGWWRGGSFGAEFLQLNANPTNTQAGSIQGYNSTTGSAPLTRAELYELWIRQEILHGKVIIRIGKVTPTRDFGNVTRPVPTEDTASRIPAVSGLLYTPMFKNPTMYGASPGFYNSASGITLNFVPTKYWYINYGAYDGNLALGVQTGERGPTFNGYYYQIAETGFVWRLGRNRLPGQAGVGDWHQTGLLQGAPGISQNGTSGVYTFGSQRLWFQNPGKNNAGVSAFFQVGHNNSRTLPINQFYGGGFTGFGLIHARPSDSVGIGVAWSQLNPNSFKRNSETMLQSYYQAEIAKGIYLQPTLTYIPTPGASPDYKGAWAATVHVTYLF